MTKRKPIDLGAADRALAKARADLVAVVRAGPRLPHAEGADCFHCELEAALATERLAFERFTAAFQQTLDDYRGGNP